MQRAIMQKSSQFSVEIIVNENTMAKELINVNKDLLCHTGLLKDHRGHPVNKPCLKHFETC